jgi:hypothetical protein
MANLLDEIVDIKIDAQTQVITTASFTIPLILAEFTDWTDSRTRTYSSYAEVAEDFTTPLVLTLATRVFGQDQSPSSVVIGRKAPTETWLQGLTAVDAENSTWFALVAGTHTPADVLALAGYIATVNKVYFSSTQDATAVGVTTTDIGAQVKALGYDQTDVMYHPAADTDYPEAAWVGSQLTFTPGSNTWEFKTLEGVAPSNLSSTARTNLENKNMSYYISIAGVNLTRHSTMADGTFIDQKIGEFWTIARMQESVFGMLVRKPKVPYTDAGFALVEAQMRSVLALGVTNGLYESYTITVPRVSDIPQNQRLQRIAGDFLFTAVLQGALHKCVIRGTVTI